MTRRGLFTILALAAATAGCGKAGSGHLATQTRSVGAFSKVDARGDLELDITGEGGPQVQVQGDDNLLSNIVTKVNGGQLVISTVGSLRPKLPLVAKVRAPTIKAIDSSGATQIRARDLTGPALSLDVSGVSDAQLSGVVGSLDLNLSGAGSVDTRALAAERITVHVSGTGSVRLGEPKTLDVHISGAGSVEYGGHPKLTQSISGVGSIRKR